ncbi:MAG: 50S ribosome-binding GTPase [Selenomonadaceae bacterium]|nr:50S ribosome-binding GTPase [Selenomonadaceae bacterium]
MRDYVAEFQKKVDEINADCQTINIINAGIMNHGKSSLFNSLIGAEVFKEGDVRVTTTIQREKWLGNAYLIDTPGLAAEDTDDTVAYEAYRRANMIVFVHTVKVGEMHENELNAVNKIKALFNDDNFFCKHFCLVLTFKESDSDESISSIRDKTLEDIRQHCGISDFQIFIVSNSRYKKGMTENKRGLVEKSGVSELREFLTGNFETWNGENKYFRGMRIGNEKKDFISQLEQERKEVGQEISNKTDKVKKRQTEFLRKLETAVSQYNEDQSRYNQAQSQLESMKAHLADLRRR